VFYFCIFSNKVDLIEATNFKVLMKSRKKFQDQFFSFDFVSYHFILFMNKINCWWTISQLLSRHFSSHSAIWQIWTHAVTKIMSLNWVLYRPCYSCWPCRLYVVVVVVVINEDNRWNPSVSWISYLHTNELA